MRERFGIGKIVVLLGAMAALLLANPAGALQERHPPWPPEAVVNIEKSTWWETLSNRYLSISLGTRGWIKPWPNQWPDAQYDVGGRWSVLALEGDPETPDDNNQQLIFLGELWLLPSLPDRPQPLLAPCPCGYFGYFKVKIQDTIYVIGDFKTGTWIKRPIVYQNPPPGHGAGRQGPYIDAEWGIPANAPTSKIHIKMGIIRDQLRFEITLTNASTTAQSMGLGINGDVMVEDSESLGYPYIAGIGYSKQAGAVPITLGTLLSGTRVPDVFEIVDSVESPVVVTRNTLRLQDCTPPDHVAIGEWWDMYDPSVWLPQGFNPDPLEIVSDVNWLLCWDPVTLAPGASRKIVTYFGMGAATANWNYRVGRKMEQDSCVLAVQGPRSLRYDSTKVGQNDLDPYPFDIKAYLYNMATDPGPYDFEEVTMTLYLPPGLTLAPGQTARQVVGRVSVNSESSPVVWHVQPTGEYSGELEYFVTARDVSGWQQIVSRKIYIPATRKGVFRSGYQLMHVPFILNNQSVQHAFGLAPGSFGAKYYDPTTNQYLPLTRLVPGQAFWIYVSTVARGKILPFALASDAAIVGEDYGRQTREQYIELKRGWNLIGNPFVYPMYWGQVLVANTFDPVISTISIDEAVTRGWISRTVFSWVPESGTYEHFRDYDRLLLPWRGYWVRANVPCTLVMRPPVPPGSDVMSKPGGY